jgi:parallel beta-helix repeat protein
VPGITGEEFTLTLEVGGSGAGDSDAGSGSRSVVGPGAESIQYGSIRNVVQVIQVDAGTGEFTHFQQVSRKNDADTGAVLTVKGPYLGNRYHFLVLMGHRERNYAKEADPRLPESPYSWKTDESGALLPPTLLAAGLLANREIWGGETLVITMKPLTVDTVFAYGGATVHAALPANGGNRPPAGTAASIVWTVSGGFAILLDAQNEAGPQSGGVGFNWGGLSLAEQKTILRFKGDSDDTVDTNAVLGGADRNQITLDLGPQNAGVSGSANFNLTYHPFGAGNMTVFTDIDPKAASWIIRNGVNDLAQNGKTVFPNTASTVSPWNGTAADTANGNGAAAFEFADQKIPHIDLAKLVPAPVTGKMPVTGAVDEGTYTGTVEWKAVVGGTSKARFEGETVYMARVTLNPATGFQFSEGGVTVTHGGSSGIVYVSKKTDTPVVVDILFPKTGAFWEYGGYFSGSAAPGKGDLDSAIDILGQAKTEGLSSLFLKLLPWPETVNFGASGDINGGLVLTAATNSPAAVTLDGGGKTIPLATGNTGSVITVGDGVTLTLRNITFVGSAGNDKPLISVAAGGKLVLEKGAVITGNGASGVSVSGAAGKLVMKGGAISGNTGTGVAVGADGVFELSGGTISGNKTANAGGGVSVAGTGKLVMTGGTISGNTASGNGGGVYLDSGSFTKQSGGTIYGIGEGALANTAGSGNGYAAYAVSGGKKRNLTAGPGVTMDSGTNDGWE